MIKRCLYFVFVISTLFSIANPAWSQEDGILHRPMLRDLQKEESAPSVTSIIVKLKSGMRFYVDKTYDWGKGKIEHRREETPLNAEEVGKLSKAAGVKLTLKYREIPKEARSVREQSPMNAAEALKRSKADGLEPLAENHVLLLPFGVTPKEAQSIADRIAKHPDVEYADPGIPAFGMRVPNDALYQSLQWNFQQSAGGVNLPPAWDTNIGGNNVVVAVLDSGILLIHADIIGRTVPGYDFVSDAVYANDGGGRDSDPTDPGDWVTQSDVTNYPTQFTGCIQSGQTMRASDWHGTHVAGIIGANSNNSIGVAGVNWISKILPVRVLGKCLKGVPNSTDIPEAIQWAAGIPFNGSPSLNTNPAKVINMSLGGTGSCPSNLQNAINLAVKKNIVIVVAAGNGDGINGVSASNTWPANCQNVVTVGSVNRQGAQSRFSNYGSVLSLSAPGGDDTGYNLDYVKSTGDSGATMAVNDNAYITEIGTSQAAPHVSGVASLMLSANYKLNFRQIKSILQKTTKIFPTGTGRDCTTALCGSGILDATAAVRAAESGIGGGEYHSVALKSDGSVWSWGFNGNGQLGDGSSLSTLRTSPGPLLTLNTSVKGLAVGVFHNMAVKSDGTLWAWGYNGVGQIGNNTITDQVTPVQVSSLTGVTGVAAGYDHTVSLKSDGTVWTWGYNFFGQLGDGTYVDKHIPVQVSGLTGIVAVAAGGKRSLALKNDGTVWAWGAEANIINATTASVSNIPLQVTGLTDVIAIAAAGDATTGIDVDTSLALKSDGTVWAWGYGNTYGQLGDGTLSGKASPVQVSGLTDVTSIAVGLYFSTAVKSDGTVWVWGSGSDGQLGNGSSGNLVYSTTPVQSLGVKNAVAIAAGAAHVMALNADLTIQEWGANAGGELGNGTTVGSPVAIKTSGQGSVGTFNTANATTGQADLSVTLSEAPLPAVAGNPLTYSFSVTNLGSGIASNASVTLALPGSTNFISASSSCTQGSGVVTCSLGNMGNGAITGLQVIVSPLAAGTLNSTVYVASDSVDLNYANNSAAISTAVNPGYTDSDVPTLPQWGVVFMGSLLLMSMSWLDRKRQFGSGFSNS